MKNSFLYKKFFKLLFLFYFVTKRDNLLIFKNIYFNFIFNRYVKQTLFRGRFQKRKIKSFFFLYLNEHNLGSSKLFNLLKNNYEILFLVGFLNNYNQKIYLKNFFFDYLFEQLFLVLINFFYLFCVQIKFNFEMLHNSLDKNGLYKDLYSIFLNLLGFSSITFNFIKNDIWIRIIKLVC
jgi:hypothetical protein